MKVRDWQALGSVTLVGSMPHRDRHKAVDLILTEISEIPVWPQLAGNKAEQMLVQYLEGLPGIRVSNGNVRVETDGPNFEQELYDFYEEYLAIESGSLNIESSRFRMGPETGKTFFQFLETIDRAPSSYRALKGQIVGPFTLLTGLKDHQDRAFLYDERFQDVVPKHLAMKAKWQIERMKSLGYPVILFLDEPALAGFGSSAFIGVSRELIQQLLAEVIDAVHTADALVGIHVCANTDWLLAFDSGVDIINLDAYNYFEKFLLYQDSFSQFTREGRIVAWGMVPTTDPQTIDKETAQSLADRWLENIDQAISAELSKKKILSQSLFTPSCGCGSLPEEAAEKVVRLTRELGLIMRAHL